jgi:uncharacterized protein
LMMGFGILASALSSQFAPKLVRASGVIVIALGLVMAQRGYLMLTTGEDGHAGMGHAMGMNMTPSAKPIVHSRIDQGGEGSVIPDIDLGVETEWMVMGDALSQCGEALVFQEEPWRFVLPKDGGLFTLKPTHAGLLHWRCENGFSQGALMVRSDRHVQHVPMAETILQLIERSAEALEALRRQLHP